MMPFYYATVSASFKKQNLMARALNESEPHRGTTFDYPHLLLKLQRDQLELVLNSMIMFGLWVSI